MKTYFDSSAFAKRYVDEDGSDMADDILDGATELALSVICVPEIVSALNRRKRERELTRHQYAEAKRCLLDDVRDAIIIDLTVPVISSALTVLESSPLRAMDALHIACALEWGAEVFVSSDKKQLAAARQAGLTTHEI